MTTPPEEPQGGEALAQQISEQATDAVEALFDEIGPATHEAISISIYDAAVAALSLSGEKVGMREALVEAGWAVAAHNDYRLNGESHTFWLWTHPSGRWIKGEGRTDAEALTQCLAALDLPPPVVAEPGQ